MKLNLYHFFLLILLSLFCFFVLIGCTAKKSTVERTKISDTLIRTTLEYKSLPIENTYTIDLVCDTITGKVKPINLSEKSGSNYANLIIENNQLKAKLKTGESKKNVDTIYKTKYKDVYKDRELVRYRTPLWMWLAIIFQTIIIILLIKRKIPFV